MRTIKAGHIPIKVAESTVRTGYPRAIIMLVGKAQKKKRGSNKEAPDNQGFSEKGLKPSRWSSAKPSLRDPTSIIKFIPILILLLVSFAVYFNSLSGGFVYDDTGQIVDNPWIRDVRNIPAIFSRSVWSFKRGIISNYYRPLMHIVYMLNYHLFGLNAWGFHLVNILFNCGVSVLVFLVIRMLLTGQGSSRGTYAYLSPPFLAAILFAVYPVHTEPVAWIAGLPDVAFTFFYLLSFYFYVRSKVVMSGSYLFSVMCFAVAALFKEPALTLPLILLAYDCQFRDKRAPLRDYVQRYLPYVIIGAGYLALRIHALGGFAPQKRHAAMSTYQYAINVCPLFIQYLGKLLLPIDLNAFYVLHPITSLLQLKGVLSLMATAVFVVLFLIAFKKSKVAFMGMTFITVPLLPVLYIPVLGENTFTDRYLYLPSVGYVLLLAIVLSWAGEKLPRAARGITIILIVMAGIYAVGTIDRNNVWHSDFNLWSDTVAKSPDSALVHYNFGLALASRGQIEKAITEYEAALRLKPGYAGAYNNLGLAWASKGQFDKAIADYQAALRIEPDSIEAHENLGIAWASKGQSDRAITEFQTALRLDPDNTKAHKNLGVAWASKGQFDKAIAEYQAALRLKPDYVEAHYELGIAWASKGQLDKAIREFQTAVRLKPDYTKAHYDLGLAYASQGLFDKAIAEFQTAIRLNPDFDEARQRLNYIVSRHH